MKVPEDRIEGCCRYARHFLKSLSVDDNDGLLAAAAFWGVDTEQYTTGAALLSAIVSAAAEWYWDRAVECHKTWSSLDKDDRTAYVDARVVLTRERDLDTLSPEDARVHLADWDMEKPIGASIKNLFPKVKEQLHAEGMKWTRSFTHKAQTQVDKKKQKLVVKANVARGALDFDLEPIVTWARRELCRLAATPGTLGNAAEVVTGRRCEELLKYLLTKYSEYEIRISSLAKTRNKDGDEDKSFIIRCLAPADDILSAVEKLHTQTAGMKQNRYNKLVITAHRRIPVFEPLADAWHFNAELVPHNNRCVYVSYLYWQMIESGELPKNANIAAFIMWALGHSSLESTLNYDLLRHVPAVKAVESAPAATEEEQTPEDEQTPDEEQAPAVTTDIDSDSEAEDIAIDQKKIELAQMELARKIKRREKRKRDEIELN
jgi:Telomere resolvase